MKQVEIKLIQLLDLLEFDTNVRIVLWGTTWDDNLEAKCWHEVIFEGKYQGNELLKRYENKKVVEFSCNINHITIDISDTEVK